MYRQKSRIKKNPLVSVIIPVFNEAKYIALCLDSLEKQTYRNKEIIVVDDGSTDASVSLINQFPVTLLFQKHQGPGAAKNYGASRANGEILVFVDADMIFDSKYISYLITPILEKKTVGTFVKDERVANPENIWSQCWSINSGLPYDRRLPKDYKDTEDAFRAIRKDIFLERGGYSTNVGYSDDSSFSKRTKIFAHNAPGAVCYHYNPSTLSEVFFSARWIGRSELFTPSITNFLRYSPLNSLRVVIKYMREGAPFAIIAFKLIYDAGMFIGIFFNYGKTSK